MKIVSLFAAFAMLLLSGCAMTPRDQEYAENVRKITSNPIAGSRPVIYPAKSNITVAREIQARKERGEWIILRSFRGAQTCKSTIV